MKIGIIGAGQLGRMLGEAGKSLGHNFAFIADRDDDSATFLGEVFLKNDNDCIKNFSDFADVATFESENTDLKIIEKITQNTVVYPSQKSLLNAQHRGREKALFRRLKIPCASSKIVHSQQELAAAISDIGLPAILKTTTEGYDGKGQFVIENTTQIEAAWASIDKAEAILEAFVDFERELSLIAVRGADGECQYYPLVENTHFEGILRMTKAPATNISEDMRKTAQSYMQKLLAEFDYIGVLTIELFATKTGLIVNEIAPRVHNSGHWSIEGAATSQFENHIRAITKIPLGSTKLKHNFCIMINIISEIGDIDKIRKIPNTHLYLYDKSPRKNRKLGHITITADSENELNQTIDKLTDFLPKD